MIEATMVFLSVYVIFVGGIALVGFLLNSEKIKKADKSQLICADDVTVLIPFRDEEERISVLLDSILKLDKYPKEIIFIDDHSTDAGSDLIAEKLTEIPYRILNSPEGQSGKKRALRRATSECTSRYILTWDADVYFESDYFINLEKLPDADMYLLPAVLKAESSMEYLYEIDVVLANALNTGLAGLTRPIMASGANFFYNREVFNEVDDLDSHNHMASGDDTYLLRDFRNNDKDVRVATGIDCAVFTETPRTFREFIDQRLRWVGKTTDIKDNLGTFIAMSQFILAITFFGLLGVSVYLGEWKMFSVLFIGKVIADLLLFFPFFLKIRRILTWSLIPIYEILFPFYSLLLFILMFTYSPTWKGRRIK